MEPILLFGFQFTLTFIAFAIIAKWYVVPGLVALPLEVALMPLIWVHAFRSIGLTILAPGIVDANVPADFRAMIGYGDLAAAILALLALRCVQLFAWCRLADRDLLCAGPFGEQHNDLLLFTQAKGQYSVSESKQYSHIRCGPPNMARSRFCSAGTPQSG